MVVLIVGSVVDEVVVDVVVVMVVVGASVEVVVVVVLPGGSVDVVVVDVLVVVLVGVVVDVVVVLPGVVVEVVVEPPGTVVVVLVVLVVVVVLVGRCGGPPGGITLTQRSSWKSAAARTSPRFAVRAAGAAAGALPEPSTTSRNRPLLVYTCSARQVVSTVPSPQEIRYDAAGSPHRSTRSGCPCATTMVSFDAGGGENESRGGGPSSLPGTSEGLTVT